MPKKRVKPLKGKSVLETVKELRDKGFEVETSAYKPMRESYRRWRETREDISTPQPISEQQAFRNRIRPFWGSRMTDPKYVGRANALRRQRENKETSKQLGAYLYGRFPNASTRRVQRILRETGTAKAKGEKAMHLISMSAGKLGKAIKRRRGVPFFGLGLTAASLGSSIKEASKK